MIIDGNLSSFGTLANAANDVGFKVSAFDIFAMRGHIQNVQIRGCGAIGAVPYSLVDGNGSGVEAFPIQFRTFDEGQGVLPGVDYPWVVEDVDVGDFYFLHGGYGTVIQGGVFWPNRPAGTATPIAVVRRCQIHGSEAVNAFGTAGLALDIGTADGNPSHVGNFGSGRIQFTENLVVGCGRFFNVDTGLDGPVSVVNNVALDVRQFAQFGTANTSQAAQQDLSFTKNLIRLRGRFAAPDYRDFYVTNNTSWGTDPTLPLGRPSTNWAAGFVVQGIAANVDLSGNYFTTWPQAQFFQPNPAELTSATWYPCWVPATQTYYDTTYYGRQREPVQAITVNQTFVSTTAYDFTGSTQLSGGYCSTTIILPRWRQLKFPT